VRKVYGEAEARRRDEADGSFTFAGLGSAVCAVTPVVTVAGAGGAGVIPPGVEVRECMSVKMESACLVTKGGRGFPHSCDAQRGTASECSSSLGG
jgi:hypothetical protein